MVDSSQIRILARTLTTAFPGMTDESDAERLVFSIGGRGFAWSFMQRDTPKQKRWPNIEVLAVSCTLDHKELLLEAAPDLFFDDAHYHGYPAILVRLPFISEDELANLLKKACAIQTAKPRKRPKTH
jgi:hypothetical protein